MINLNAILEDAKTVAVSGHVRPDGDCIGSTTALYEYICSYYPQIDADLYLEEVPHTFDNLKRVPDIMHEVIPEKSYDVFFILDCGDPERLGFSQSCISKAKKTVCIDHHISNAAFADENYIVPDASSTSELIYNLLDSDQITKEIAESLYIGIIHDTGVFQYTNTSPSTMKAGADLIGKGIDFTTIIEDTFYKKTYVQNRVMGKALLDSEMLLGGKVIYSLLTKEVLDQYEALPKHLNGIVNQLRVTTGVEVAVFVYELGDQEYKVSLRANGTTDMSKVSMVFGGGGHVKAAGFSYKTTDVKEMKNRIVAELSEAMKEAGEL